MASAATSSPDALITLKVNQDGFTKKLKLPLRDLGASTLEGKVRHELGCLACPGLRPSLPLGRPTPSTIELQGCRVLFAAHCNTSHFLPVI